MVCQQMVADWGPGQFGSERIVTNIASWTHDGTVTFLLGRLQWPYIYRIVADADGAVRQTILETSTSTCTLGGNDLRDARAVYRIYDSESGKLSGLGGGAYGADLDDLRPRVMTHYHIDSPDNKLDVRDYVVSKMGLFEGHTIRSIINQYDWATAKFVRQITSITEENGFSYSNDFPQGDALFWSDYSNLAYNKLRVWTLDAGPHDLISFGNDWTKSAMKLGVDDTWMAWAQGDGRTSSIAMFDKIHLMAGPRTIDPSAVSGTVLTTVAGYSPSTFVVGCGYAAATAAVSFDAGSFDPANLLLFRLSDGRRWQFPTAFPQR